MKRSPQYYALLVTIGLFLLAILCSFKTHAQYIGISGGNKGFCFSGGILSQGIQIEASYRLPFMSNVIPSCLSLTVGKEILITRNEEDNFSITPFVGFGSLNRKDFSKYDATDKIIEVSEIKTMYGLEIGKDFHAGRIFLSANKCGIMSFTFGLKTFLNRL